MAYIQYGEALKLLQIISSTYKSRKNLTYKSAAKLLGRVPPGDHARAVAQMCDLLDAAAALAGVPLLALVRVRIGTGQVNPKAWKRESEIRERIIRKSTSHRFTADDFRAIRRALKTLEPKGNRKAWAFVWQEFTKAEIVERLATPAHVSDLDAIDDLGTDAPARSRIDGWAYARDPRIRAAVMKRAKGRCEFCGVLGFIRTDGTPYLESHHIIALAKDGEDRMTNVIGLCPNHHREAHSGRRGAQLERQMIQKVQALCIVSARRQLLRSKSRLSIG